MQMTRRAVFLAAVLGVSVLSTAVSEARNVLKSSCLEKVKIWRNCARSTGDSRAELLLFPAPADKNTGLSVIVCPGGSYYWLDKYNEGTNVAGWLNENGITAYVLYYRRAKYGHHFPSMTQDLERAMQLVRYGDGGSPAASSSSSSPGASSRSLASLCGADPDKVGVMGFSAGGHLAGILGTWWNWDLISEKVGRDLSSDGIFCNGDLSGDTSVASVSTSAPASSLPLASAPAVSASALAAADFSPAGPVYVQDESAVPDESTAQAGAAVRSGRASRMGLKPYFAAMIYPVVTMEDPVAHDKSRRNFLGKKYGDADLQHRLSLEKQVHPDMPPVFLVCCKDDTTVDCRNSEHYSESLEAAGVKHLFLEYEKSGHGFGVTTAGGHNDWAERFILWVNQL